MDAFLQDTRYAVRGLLRSPGFTAAALVTLALGTGANATVFGFVNALLLRPASQVTEPASLYSIYTSDFSSGPFGATSYPDYLSIREAATNFASVAAYSESPAVFRDGETTERVRVMSVSPELFAVLGVRAEQGRLLADSDFAADAERAVVISHHLWQRALGGSEVLGRSVAVNGRQSTIVGVAARGFDGLNLGGAVDVWSPLIGRSGDASARGNRNLSLAGRLRAGESLNAAQAQLDTIAANLARAYPATNMGTLADPGRPRPMVAVPHSRIHPRFRGMVSMLSAILMSAVGLVLLVACANVAGLLLSRGAARTREITTRMALGASRTRVLSHLLTESVLLGIGGGALGVLVALWTSDVLPSFFPAEQARLLDARVDGRVLAFTAVLSLTAGVLFGAIPALKVLRSSQGPLHADGHRLAEPRSGFLRAGLVLGQVALTFVLLVACGLLVRSVANALSADLGFGTRDAVLANLEIPSGELMEPQGRAYFDDVLTRVRALPGVEAASLVRTLTLSRTGRRLFTIDGYTPRPGEDMELNINIVEASYFATMRIPLLDGRAFDGRDGAGGARVVIVNDTLAHRYFGGDAVGRQIREGGRIALDIIGVVKGGKHLSVQEPPVPTVFYPLAQSYSPAMSLVARTAGEPAMLADAVRTAAQEANRSVAVFRVTTLESHVSETLGAERLTAALLTAAGTMALVLAIVGLYGVMAYGVVRRTKEIGIRIALGARPVSVVGLVVREGLLVAIAGIGVGVAGALAGTRLLSSMLYGVEPWDAATFGATALALAAIAAVSAWAPARRAVRLDPVAALRQD